MALPRQNSNSAASSQNTAPMNRIPQHLHPGLRAPLLALLLTATCATASPRPSPVEPEPPLSAWQTVPAKSLDDETPAARQGERVLAWQKGRSLEPAQQVFLRVDAAFEQVQPLLQAALSGLGGYKTSQAPQTLAYLSDPWPRVWLSRRPDLRAALVQGEERARLEQAVRDGAMSPDEARTELAWALASTDSAPQDRIGIPAWQAQTPSYLATRQERFGLWRSSRGVTRVEAFDAGFLFGRPTTAVRLGREDTYPNPRYKFFDWNRNILSSAPSKELTHHLVPAPAFEALAAALRRAKLPFAVASSPLAWAEPVAQPEPPAVSLQAPGESRSLRPQSFALTRLPEFPDGITYPGILLALPGGDLLLSGEFFRHGRREQGVWRLSRQGDTLAAQAVWTGRSPGRRLTLSRDGGSAWFSGLAGAEGTAPQLFRYDVAARRLVSAPLPGLPAAGGADDKTWPDNDWLLDGEQQPLAWTRSYSGTGSMAAWQLQGQAPQEGRWKVAERLRSTRPAYVQEVLSQVLLRQARRLWAIDRSLVEWDADSGRLLHSWPLPQRFGDFPPAPGVQQRPSGWDPQALGSAEGGWVALGFTYLLPEKSPGVPLIEARAAVAEKEPVPRERHSGVHVMDTASGRVRLSALVGPGLLSAFARSAGGRWLAVGGDPAWPRLWDLDTGGAGYQLAEPAQAGTRPPHPTALAFSWDGRSVWGLSQRQLLRWELPAEAADAAGGGRFPDQSRR